MSVPLRKDEFDDQELTTADLAQGKRPAPVEDRSREDQTNKNQPKQDSPNDARFGRPS